MGLQTRSYSLGQGEDYAKGPRYGDQLILGVPYWLAMAIPRSNVAVVLSGNRCSILCFPKETKYWLSDRDL